MQQAKAIAEDVDEEMRPEDATRCRAIAARAMYLSQDRSDVQFASKELARRMAKPKNEDWHALKRLGRYLIGRIRYVSVF